MFQREGRDKYILSNMRLQMGNYKELDDKLKKSFCEFVDKYFEYIHGEQRSEIEAG
jgi:hypothetical protein